MKIKHLNGAYFRAITANAPDNDNATYSVTLEGTGALSPKVA